MIIQLLKDGVPVLSAKSDHRHGDSGARLPISYEGEANLISPPLERASVSLLESIFSLLARKHGFEVAGDYDQIMPKHNLKGFEQEAGLK